LFREKSKRKAREREAEMKKYKAEEVSNVDETVFV